MTETAINNNESTSEQARANRMDLAILLGIVALVVAGYFAWPAYQDYRATIRSCKMHYGALVPHLMEDPSGCIERPYESDYEGLTNDQLRILYRNDPIRDRTALSVLLQRLAPGADSSWFRMTDEEKAALERRVMASDVEAKDKG